MARGKVVVFGTYESGDAPKDALAELFPDLVEQIERDAIAGTFDELNASIFRDAGAFESFKVRNRAAAQCFDDSDDEGVREGKFRFRLELAAELFSDPDYGLQKLVHLLASDLFERRIGQYNGRPRVKDVDLSALMPLYDTAYRTHSHSVAAIRQAFSLGAKQPLVAFTMKPRACLSAGDYLYIAEAAFKGGCHIVELDTRDLDLAGDERLDVLERLSELAMRESRERVCRFSANLSGPSRVVGAALKRLSAVHERFDAQSPWVVKVDGNLDGLSTVQAIRANAFGLHTQPIITSYPVLKYALQPALGRNAFVKMLAMSGVDIIYPGQSPSFGRSDRRIDTQAITAAQRHYREMDLGGYPMLSVAGGIAINSVHAYLSVLGPDIAFFVGGGIALSQQGVRRGAKNFVDAVELSRRDLFEHEEIRNLQEQFVDLSTVYFEKGDIPPEYEFVRPSELRGVPDVHQSASLR